MTYLYPRLLKPAAEATLRAQREKRPQDLRNPATPPTGVMYAALGGVPAPESHLAAVAAALRALADALDFPNPPSDAAATDFDRRAARLLHQELSILPAEAASRDMWSYMALVLVPDVVRWRWFRSANTERWVGTDLTRHALGRLWWQADSLVPAGSADYSLVGVLLESEANQIFERRNIAGDRRLVQEIVRQLDGLPTPRQRGAVRDGVLRILRYMAFVDSACLSDDELVHFVQFGLRTARRTTGSPRTCIADSAFEGGADDQQTL